MPGQITLKPDATMILAVEFAAPLSLDKTCREYKLMGERLGSGTTDAGTSKFTIDTKQNPVQAMVIDNVPAFSGSDEVTLRITGSFFNDVNNQINTLSVSVNSNKLNPAKFFRGEMKAKHNLCLSTIEVDVPLSYLKVGSNDISVSYGNTAGFACCQLQYWKFSDAPGRGDDNIAVTGVTIPETLTMQVGEETSIAAAIAPANASNKTITWSSDNSSVTVDKYGLLTAKSTGSATITATCGGQSDQCVITVNAYSPTAATGVSFEEAPVLNIGHNEFYRLAPLVSPEDADIESITWESTDEGAVLIYDNGTINGLEIGSSATVKVTVKDKSGNSHQASLLVNVGVAGEEYISCAGIEDTVSAGTEFDFTVTVNTIAARDIKLELVQGSTILGTGTTSAVKNGMSRVAVNLGTSAIPDEGDYTVKGYLLDGANVISFYEEPLYIQKLLPDSISVTDWLWEVQKDGGTLQIEAVVYPEDAFDKTILWSSSDVSKATVSASGLVTGGSVTGLVTITGTTQSGGVTKDIVIDVKDALVVTATSITLPDVINVFPGTTHELMVEYNPSWATDKDITWSVGNTGVVNFTSGNTMNVSGAEGTSTTISGVYDSNSSLTVSATVKVSDKIIIEAEEFENTGGSYDDDADGGTNVAGAGANRYTTGGKGAINFINSGDWMTYPTYIPATGMYNVSFYAGTDAPITDGVISFKVDGEALGNVTVINGGWDNFQLVTINNVYIEKGAKTITVEAIGGSLYQWNLEHFELEMAGPVNVTGVEVTPEEWKLVATGTKKLTATILPESATNQNITWSSDATGVATVDPSTGIVTAQAVGTANIIAVTEDGSFKDTCLISVESQILIDSIQVTPAQMQLSAGNSKQISITIFPEYAVNQTLTFTSNNTDTATVSATGLVYGVADGITTITVAATDGSGVSKDVEIVVAPVAVESISILQGSTASVNVGSTVSLNAIITPGNASNQNVSWSSDDTGVASVSQSGVVRGEGDGTATITVTTEDGGKTATCDVTVTIVNSITENSIENVFLYPNPATSSVSLNGLGEGEFAVKVYNAMGALVLSDDAISSVDNSVSIDNLSSGIYVLVLESDKGTKVLRFQKGN